MDANIPIILCFKISSTLLPVAGSCYQQRISFYCFWYYPNLDVISYIGTDLNVAKMSNMSAITDRATLGRHIYL